MQRIAVVLLVTMALAGCSDGGKDAGTGSFSLAIQDSLSKGSLTLKGAYVHGPTGWSEALVDAPAFEFDGSGDNVTASGRVPAGSHDRLRLLFDQVHLDGREALLKQSGLEIAVNFTVPKEGSTAVGLAFAWPDSFFESAQGLAFTPVLSRLVVTVDGSEVTRLEAQDITTGAGKAPVARMRIFDATGLEVFASNFVADSPKNPVVGNAGNITFSATGSEALQPGATIASSSWEIGGATYVGNTISWPAPLDGGNFTVRLTVTDSAGNQDAQNARLAIKPGTATRTLSFTGTATGFASLDESAQEHTFAVDNATLDGATATLSQVTVVLSPGAATVPVSDLDLILVDGSGEEVGAEDGAGSQHTLEADVEGAASGTWAVRVLADPAYEATYTVTVTLTWKGVNPGIEAFLADYDDGHSHQH